MVLALAFVFAIYYVVFFVATVALTTGAGWIISLAPIILAAAVTYIVYKKMIA